MYYFLFSKIEQYIDISFLTIRKTQLLRKDKHQKAQRSGVFRYFSKIIWFIVDKLCRRDVRFCRSILKNFIDNTVVWVLFCICQKTFYFPQRSVFYDWKMIFFFFNFFIDVIIYKVIQLSPAYRPRSDRCELRCRVYFLFIWSEENSQRYYLEFIYNNIIIIDF